MAVLIERYRSPDLVEKKIEHFIDGRKLLQDLKGKLQLEGKKLRQMVEIKGAAIRHAKQAGSRSEYTLNLPLGRSSRLPTLPIDY